MTVDFSFGTIDNLSWARLQANTLKRDDAQNFPAILLYPSDTIQQEDVEFELAMLEKVMGRCPFAFLTDQTGPDKKVVPARLCSVEGHCINRTDAGEKPDVLWLLTSPETYDYQTWASSNFNHGQLDVLETIAMGDQDWTDRFLANHEARRWDEAAGMFHDQKLKWSDRQR